MTWKRRTQRTLWITASCHLVKRRTARGVSIGGLHCALTWKYLLALYMSLMAAMPNASCILCTSSQAHPPCGDANAPGIFQTRQHGTPYIDIAYMSVEPIPLLLRTPRIERVQLSGRSSQEPRCGTVRLEMSPFFAVSGTLELSATPDLMLSRFFCVSTHV